MNIKTLREKLRKKEYVVVKGRLEKDDVMLLENEQLDIENVIGELVHELCDQMRNEGAFKGIVVKEPVRQAPVRGDFNYESTDIAKVLRFIRQNPQGVTSAQVIEATNCPASSVHVHLTKLVERGQIIKDTTGYPYSYSPAKEELDVVSIGNP